MSKRVLFVVNNYGFFLSHRMDLARAVARSGYEVKIAAGQMHNFPNANATAEFPIRAVKFSRRGMNPVSELKTIYSLYKIFRQEKPDLVHLLTIKPSIYGGIAARLARVPAVVAGITGLGYVFIAKGFVADCLRVLVRVLYRIAFGHPRLAVIFQNPDDQQIFRDQKIVQQDQCVLIRGSGVDPAVFYEMEIPSGEPLVILGARLLWDKGVREFVEAARELKAKGVRARFALLGEADFGNPTSVTLEDVEKWKANGPVEVWGHCSEMLDAFKQAAIVCLPSYREGVPRFLIEGASCARPLVATDVPGCREIVRNGENGYLVPPYDSRSLAEALEKLIRDRDLQVRMGRRGREMVISDFSLEFVCSRTVEVYRKLL